MPPEPSYRLFFALWPPDALRAGMVNVVHRLAGSSGGRAVPSANFHITLAFLGQVRLPRIDQALSAAATIRAAPFELRLDRIEPWPEANVLCLIPSEVPPELPALAERLRFNLSEQQFRMERRRFRPHVTLARDLPGRVPPVSTPSLQWSVDEFALVRSQPAAGGAKYSILARWPLQGVDTMA